MVKSSLNTYYTLLAYIRRLSFISFFYSHFYILTSLLACERSLAYFRSSLRLHPKKASHLRMQATAELAVSKRVNLPETVSFPSFSLERALPVPRPLHSLCPLV